jgi:cell division protein FtsB
MKWFARIQQFAHSLALVTWLGFALVCVIFGTYAVLLRAKELRTRTILRNELREVQDENQQLARQNQKLEQQIEALRGEQTGAPADLPNQEYIDIELQQGQQRSFRYTVKKGDTIWDIAEMYAVDVKALMRWNNLSPRSRIFPGDQLIIILDDEPLK